MQLYFLVKVQWRLASPGGLLEGEINLRRQAPNRRSHCFILKIRTLPGP